MAVNPTDTLSTQIHTSRDQTRTQISNYIKHYLELENVDLVDSSFLSFIINVISTLTSNLMFYQSSVYREFYLTKAQLPDSVYNLAAFLGYDTQNASYATANVLMTISLTFEDSEATFTIPSGFIFYADSIEFVTYFTTTVTVTNNRFVSIQANENGKLYDLPVSIDSTANNEFYFILPVRQYKSTTQEFQIDEDLQLYQFTSVDVPITGKLSSISVYVKDPDSDPSDTGLLYTAYNSLYLMSSDDYGYVSRRTVDGVTLHFGNGLIGQQPLPGSTVIVYINETEGTDGNVIPGSIKKGQRIYTTTDEGITQIVNYSCINTSAATGGVNEETLQEIRSNAIAGLTTLNRLVTENDYENSDVVIEDSPIAQNSIPVLKRSDVKCNEIQLYTTLTYNNENVPTRNATYTTSTGTTYIPRETEITIGDYDYYTIFDMTIDEINTAAYYQYVLSELEQVPTLVESWADNPYNINLNNLEIVTNDSTANFTITYYSDESDYSNVECEMRILQTDEIFTMTNTPGIDGGTFTYSFSPYTLIENGSLTFYFTLTNPTGYISQYSTNLTYRKSLNSFMMSNTVSDGTSIIIYDIPVIEKEYYDAVDKREFELQVLQAMMSSMNFINYRMLTDFTNVKFTNSHGSMTNMQLNDVTRRPVIDIVETLPISPSVADRYIVCSGTHKNEIAICTDSTSVAWIYTQPILDDMLYVTNLGRKYIFSDSGWVDPDYNIPLEIELEVVRSSTADANEVEIVEDIKEALIEEFQDRFGQNIRLYRSEIIDVVQEVSGIVHCRLVNPKSSIFFNFDVDNLTEDELLAYGPEYVYFDEDSITVRVLAET